MKALKKKMVWFVVVLCAGILLAVINGINGGNSAITSFSSGLIAVCLLKIVQFVRIMKNKELLKKFEIQQEEERLIMLSEKSGRFTFLLSIWGEVLAVFILMMMQKTEIATIISSIAAIQTVVYAVIYYALSKKY